MAEMSQLDKEILEEVKFLKDRYFTYDEPVPFEGVFLYPVSVKNYNEFMSCSSCCTLNKNDEPKGIRMSTIDYFISKMRDPQEGVQWSAKFTRLMELCLHIKSELYCPNCGKRMSYEEYMLRFQQAKGQEREKVTLCECGAQFVPTIETKKDETTNKTVFYFEGHKIDNQNFMRMKKYIMYQNLPDFRDDSWVDKDIREDQMAKNELVSKTSGTASLERKIIGIASNTSYKINEVYDLSIRKFLQLLSMIDDMINYKTTQQGLKSGFVSLKKGTTIPHWLYQKEDSSIYGKAVSLDEYRSQIH